MKSLTYGMFRYWTDGGTPAEAVPDPPTGAEARPFIVRVSNDHYIPVNALVFARGRAHARQRVLAALGECRDKDYHDGTLHYRHRAIKILDDIKSGEMTVEIEPCDIACMPSVQHAINGGL